MAQTEGELLLEDYFKGQGLTWMYEQPTGSTQVDYLVHTRAGDVLCEVKDFDENDVDRTLRAGAVLGLDPYRRIRKKINDARVQFRPYRGRGLPCVLVLHNSRSVSVTLDGFSVYGAMFGDLGFEVALKPPYSTRPHVDVAKATLKRLANTTISGVAILDRYRFNQPLLDEEIRKRVDDDAREHTTDDDRAIVMVERIFRAFEEIQLAYPDVNFDSTAPRVRWVPNPHAAVAMPQIFGGPYDRVLEPFS